MGFVHDRLEKGLSRLAQRAAKYSIEECGTFTDAERGSNNGTSMYTEWLTSELETYLGLRMEVLAQDTTAEGRDRLKLFNRQAQAFDKACALFQSRHDSEAVNAPSNRLSSCKLMSLEGLFLS